jgi:hypothetical protein
MLKNVSAEGLGLTVNRPVSAGMFLTLRLPTGPQGGTEPRLVQVKHVRAHPGGSWWGVGATFLKPLAKPILDGLRVRSPSLVRSSERRTAARHTTRMKEPCDVVCVTERGPWRVAVRNASITGIGLIATREFRRGDLLTLALPSPARRLVVLRTTHVQARPGKKYWVLGGTFLQPLNADELKALIAEPPTSPGPMPSKPPAQRR